VGGGARPDGVKLPADKRPPPREVRVRVGTSYGIELGMAYEVSKEGRLVRTQVLPMQDFREELPPPPGTRPVRRP
jgi:hypothetical protein